MVDPLEILRAKKAKILADAQREAESLDADARELERFKALAEKYGLAVVEKGAPVKEAISRPDTNGAAYKAAISVAEQALKAAGKPLELSELFDACHSVGVRLAGKRPQSTLSAYLAHDKSTVHSIRKGVYWLKGVPEPQ